MNVKAMKETALDLVASTGHDHLLEYWDSLEENEQHELFSAIQSLDFTKLNESFAKSIEVPASEQKCFEPPKGVMWLKDQTEDQVSQWRLQGLDLICQGKVGVIILAGGQGTRLGSNKPKGCYSVSLPSNKSLFQLHVERILRIQSIAQESAPSDEASPQVIIPLYIMTSVHTHEETLKFFQDNGFFGMVSSQVKCFQQASIPCFTENGKIILETKSKLAMSPDGNGGIYSALEDTGCLGHMIQQGVECVDCFSVDNLLAKPADPTFLGYCWKVNSPCGARVVSKDYPEEKVGVFVLSNGRHRVVEYSEMPEELAHSSLFNCGNICMHYFTTCFLTQAAKDTSLQYHVARKKIQSVNSTVQGIKLEKFIFDVFSLTKEIALTEVLRDEEFAPVKNSPGSLKDSPETAKQSLLALHRKWIQLAGGKMSDDNEIEVSPLVSYAGENLLEKCQGKDFTSNETTNIT